MRLQVQIETALRNLKKPERLQNFLQKFDDLKHLAPYATPVASAKRFETEEAAYLEWQRLRAALTEECNLKQVYGLNPVVDSDVDTMMDPHFPQNDVVDGDLARRIHSSWS